MRKAYRVISTIVLAAFLLNTVASDLAFGAPSIRPNTDNLAPGSLFSNLRGAQPKDMATIKNALEAQLPLLVPKHIKSIPPEILRERIVKRATAKNAIFDLPGMQFFVHEVMTDGSRCSVKCRITDKDTKKPRTYYTVFSLTRNSDGIFPVSVLTELEYKKFESKFKTFDAFAAETSKREALNPRSAAKIEAVSVRASASGSAEPFRSIFEMSANRKIASLGIEKYPVAKKLVSIIVQAFMDENSGKGMDAKGVQRVKESFLGSLEAAESRDLIRAGAVLEGIFGSLTGPKGSIADGLIGMLHTAVSRADYTKARLETSSPNEERFRAVFEDVAKAKHLNLIARNRPIAAALVHITTDAFLAESSSQDVDRGSVREEFSAARKQATLDDVVIAAITLQDILGARGAIKSDSIVSELIKKLNEAAAGKPVSRGERKSSSGQAMPIEDIFGGLVQFFRINQDELLTNTSNGILSLPKTEEDNVLSMSFTTKPQPGVVRAPNKYIYQITLREGAIEFYSMFSRTGYSVRTDRSSLIEGKETQAITSTIRFGAGAVAVEDNSGAEPIKYKYVCDPSVNPLLYLAWDATHRKICAVVTNEFFDDYNNYITRMQGEGKTIKGSLSMPVFLPIDKMMPLSVAKGRPDFKIMRPTSNIDISIAIRASASGKPSADKPQLAPSSEQLEVDQKERIKELVEKLAGKQGELDNVRRALSIERTAASPNQGRVSELMTQVSAIEVEVASLETTLRNIKTWPEEVLRRASASGKEESLLRQAPIRAPAGEQSESGRKGGEAQASGKQPAGQTITIQSDISKIRAWAITERYVAIEYPGYKLTVHDKHTGLPILKNLDDRLGFRIAGNYLAVNGYFPSPLVVYDLTSGKRVKKVYASNFQLTDECLAVDNRTTLNLGSMGECDTGSSLTIYDLKTGKIIPGLKGLDALGGFSLGDKYVPVRNKHKKLTVYSRVTGKALEWLSDLDAFGGVNFTGKSRGLSDLDTSDGFYFTGKFLATKGKDGCVVLRNVETRQIVKKMSAFANLTDKYFSGWSGDNKLTMFYTETGEPVKGFENLTDVAGSKHSDEYLLVWDKEGKIRRYDLTTAMETKGLSGIVVRYAWEFNGRYLEATEELLKPLVIFDLNKPGKIKGLTAMPRLVGQTGLKDIIPGKGNFALTFEESHASVSGKAQEPVRDKAAIGDEEADRLARELRERAEGPGIVEAGKAAALVRPVDDSRKSASGLQALRGYIKNIAEREKITDITRVRLHRRIEDGKLIRTLEIVGKKQKGGNITKGAYAFRGDNVNELVECFSGVLNDKSLWRLSFNVETFKPPYIDSVESLLGELPAKLESLRWESGVSHEFGNVTAEGVVWDGAGKVRGILVDVPSASDAARASASGKEESLLRQARAFFAKGERYVKKERYSDAIVAFLDSSRIYRRLWGMDYAAFLRANDTINIIVQTGTFEECVRASRINFAHLKPRDDSDDLSRAIYARLADRIKQIGSLNKIEIVNGKPVLERGNLIVDEKGRIRWVRDIDETYIVISPLEFSNMDLKQIMPIMNFAGQFSNASMLRPAPIRAKAAIGDEEAERIARELRERAEGPAIVEAGKTAALVRPASQAAAVPTKASKEDIEESVSQSAALPEDEVRTSASGMQSQEEKAWAGGMVRMEELARLQDEADKEIAAMIALAGSEEIVSQIPTHPSERFLLLMTEQFFANGELVAHRAKFGDRFDVDNVSGMTDDQFIANVLAKAKGREARTVVLVSNDLPLPQLEKLTNAGIRFVRTDTTALLKARVDKDPYREKFQLDTYVMMLLMRRIDKDITPDSSLYRVLSFYLRSHFALSDSMAVSDYINAIVNNDIARLIKGYLTYRQITPYDAKAEYENAAKALISA